jgi:chemotaxis protein MotB
MGRKREEEPEKENAERWLLTYSDLITLLMIFFVVMYSMSKVDANKFQAVAESLSAALGGGTPAKVEVSTSPNGPSFIEKFNTNKKPPETAPNPSEESKENKNTGNVDVENMTIDAIKQKLDKFASDNGIQTKLVSSIEERGLVISIQDTLLFESGSADITPNARKVLEKIINVLASAPNYIKVEGHTDNLPINTARFPSNWELSVLRATNVVHIMLGKIDSDRLSATGFGEYRPVAKNDTEVGRALNRRVDLVILRSKYDMTEPGQQKLVDPSIGAAVQPIVKP